MPRGGIGPTCVVGWCFTSLSTASSAASTLRGSHLVDRLLRSPSLVLRRSGVVAPPGSTRSTSVLDAFAVAKVWRRFCALVAGRARGPFPPFPAVVWSTLPCDVPSCAWPVPDSRSGRRREKEEEDLCPALLFIQQEHDVFRLENWLSRYSHPPA